MPRSTFLVRSFFLSFSALVLALSANAQLEITTLAGNGPNNVPATSAGLATTTGTVMDSTGNIYIAACDTNRVFKVDTSGTLTVFAGNGAAAFQGDGGLAVNAALNFPTGLAIDSSDNIYIADTENNRVRMVTAATGVITTIAGNGIAGFRGDGGSAINAELNSPTGVAVDASGNIYIADNGNNRIRKVTAGKISTVAGNGTVCADPTTPCGDGGPATAAQLAVPAGVAVDTVPNIFIADSGDNRIREVDAVTGNISTVAGTGVAGFSGDGGPATLAQLNFPQAVFVDLLGNILIADSANSAIREVSGGTINTVAGTGTAGFSGDGGPATSADLNFPLGIYADTVGDLFIADSNNSRTREVDVSGTIFTIGGNGSVGFSGDGGPAFQAELGIPDGAIVNAASAAGNIFISDAADNRVREVINFTGAITTFAGTGTAGYSGDGGPAGSAELNFPDALAFDSLGNFFIADAMNNVVRMVDTSGTITTVAGDGTMCADPTTPCGDGGPATSAQLNFPGGIAVDFFGNLFIADILDNRIREVDAITGNISTVAGTGVACTGTLASCGDGGLATSAQLNTAEYVAIDVFGDIFIADSGDNAIREVFTSGPNAGNITTVAGTGTAGFSGDGGPATSAELNFPEAVCLQPSGDMVIVDSANNRVRTVDATTGVIATSAGNGVAAFAGDGGSASGPASLDFPEAAGVASDTKFFVADTFSGRIRTVATTLAAATRNLGKWVIGTTSSPDVVTLTNTGTTPLMVSSIVFSGGAAADYSQTNTCISHTVNPGLACFINVRVKPSVTGPRATTLTVTDNLNGVSGSTQTLSLVATGVNFLLSSTPTTRTVTRPNSVSYTLKVTPQAGFTGTVALTCTGNPSNTTCTIMPSSVTITSTAQFATLTLATTLSSPTGTFMFQANGTFTDPNGVMTTRTVTLTVTIK